jgi:prepilin-type N-terminal cleavage/methylation domain-containing protein/prepilin-type processing-associated H-X9-DG protein
LRVGGRITGKHHLFGGLFNKKMKSGIMKKNGFTLIELLVVIAIIALLLSIVFPSLKKAKDKTKDIICRSRVKGIGQAILLYLNDNDSRAFDNRSSNGHLWYDANGQLITPANTSWWPNAYWGLGYRTYASDEKVFSCPSFVLKDLTELLYINNANYQTTKTDLKHASGYGLNSFFFYDPEAPNSDINKFHRRIAALKSPSRFIVAHDHVEPKMEGDYSGGDQDDMFYIPAGSTYNLVQYRSGTRQIYYKQIFRHCKRNPALDEPSQLIARIPSVNINPNGNADVLFADGSVDKILETTGQNIPHSMYSGITN